MEHITFKEIFASIAYYSAEFTLIKTFIWLLIAIVAVYLFYFGYSKTLFSSKKKKDRIKTDTRLPLALLWALVSFMVLFSILLTVLIYYVNFNSIAWANYKTYFAFFKNQTQTLFPYLTCYFGVIMFYFIKNLKFKKNLKSI
jgi:ABC-type Fe3+ transport system permease subunit